MKNHFIESLIINFHVFRQMGFSLVTMLQVPESCSALPEVNDANNFNLFSAIKFKIKFVTTVYECLNWFFYHGRTEQDGQTGYRF